LFDSVSALLFRHDPIGIAFDNENTDEYDPETGTILADKLLVDDTKHITGGLAILEPGYGSTLGMLVQWSDMQILLPRFGCCGSRIASPLQMRIRTIDAIVRSENAGLQRVQLHCPPVCARFLLRDRPWSVGYEHERETFLAPNEVKAGSIYSAPVPALNL
jgi:hypothetical protein